MDLKIKDVAELLNVSTTTIRRWLKERKIPAYHISNQYRFSRIEIEDWVMNQRLTQSGPDFEKKDRKGLKEEKGLSGRTGTKQYSLYRAIHKGGVMRHIDASSKEKLISKVVIELAPSLDLDVDVLNELLLDREALQPTGLGQGFAVPHTRDSLLEPHQQETVAIVQPKQPLSYGSLDGQPVHTLFFLFARDDKRHLHLLAKIAHLCQQPQATLFFQQQPKKEEILAYVKKWEGEFCNH